MLMAASASPSPWYAPAMNGLSSGIFEKTTILAQPKPRCGAVARAISRMISPILRTASMLMPALWLATLTEAQTRCVADRTRGRLSMTTASPPLTPLWTRAVKPPTRSMPHSFAASSSVCARRSAASCPCPASRCEAGEIARRLLVTGMPYFAPHAVARAHQRRGVAEDVLPQLAADALDVRPRAGIDVQAQRDRADVQVLGVEHLDGRENLLDAKHQRWPPGR